MKRNSVFGVACALMILAGCGDDSDNTSTPPRTDSVVARGAPTATAPAAPRPSGSDVTVSDERSARTRFRAAGRSWQGCGKTVYNSKTGYDLYAVAVSGPLSCPAATAV